MINSLLLQVAKNCQEQRLKALLKRPLTMIQAHSGILNGLGIALRILFQWRWKKQKKSMDWHISHVQVVEMVSSLAMKSTRKKMAKWSRFQKETGTTMPKKKRLTLRRYIPTRLSWKSWKALVVLQVRRKFIYWNLPKKDKKHLNQANLNHQLLLKNQK